MKKLLWVLFAFAFLTQCNTKDENKNSVWSKEKANDWYAKTDWPRGSDYIPASAINQLEMWQAETFDSATIDKELQLAQSIGFNAMRVYLHHLAWLQDRQGFKERVNKYLSIADKHQIKTIFVFFDDCWNANYDAGTQPDPKPGIHNSGWLRDPGDLYYTDSTLVDTLQVYVKDILSSFAKDSRILLWDLYNEPGNSGYGNKSFDLVKKIFSWAREVNPDQPLSVGLWNDKLIDLNVFQLANSDVITYHNYENETAHARAIDSLQAYGRPLICTEYMARTRGSYFANIMPLLKKDKIGAINWGFVAGKTNTIYAWDTPLPDGSQPIEWFHDIFQKDGSVYSVGEVNLIKKLTGVNK